MTDDIVTRLREWASQFGTYEGEQENAHDLRSAADEIERWRNIATQLHMWLLPDWEDWEVAKAGVYAMEMYEKAVRGE